LSALRGWRIAAAFSVVAAATMVPAQESNGGIPHRSRIAGRIDGS
jgi:hypothetical protein